MHFKIFCCYGDIGQWFASLCSIWKWPFFCILYCNFCKSAWALYGKDFLNVNTYFAFFYVRKIYIFLVLFIFKNCHYLPFLGLFPTCPHKNHRLIVIMLVATSVIFLEIYTSLDSVVACLALDLQFICCRHAHINPIFIEKNNQW